MDDQLLKGRVALVTGGTTGLGFGAAERLIAAGAIVYITGRRQSVLDEATAKLGASAHGLQADASSKADMLRVAEAIRAKHGKLDICSRTQVEVTRRHSSSSPKSRSTAS
jgi:NAD(P)-dependent dehydrogenase (short-subunit alcohol dehydrogenase family)